MAYSNNNNEPTITMGTAAEYSKPKRSPALRTSVVIANTEDAVTGPRMSHLNNLRLTTLSGHETPKNATEYAMITNNADTNKLFRTAIIQNSKGWLVANPEPNSRNGYEPNTGANAPMIKYRILRRLVGVTVRW